MRSHQRMIPSRTDLKRASESGSMGRTCLQSGSSFSAVLIQFVKAIFSSSADRKQTSEWHRKEQGQNGAETTFRNINCAVSPTRERVLCAFAWKLRRPSDGQDAFFSVQDFPESLCHRAAPQLLDYLEERERPEEWYQSLLCVKSCISRKGMHLFLKHTQRAIHKWSTKIYAHADCMQSCLWQW